MRDASGGEFQKFHKIKGVQKRETFSFPLFQNLYLGFYLKRV